MALLAAGVALSAAGCNLSAVTPTPAPRDAPTIRFQLPAPDATFREGEEVDAGGGQPSRPPPHLP